MKTDTGLKTAKNRGLRSFDFWGKGRPVTVKVKALGHQKTGPDRTFKHYLQECMRQGRVLNLMKKILMPKLTLPALALTVTQTLTHMIWMRILIMLLSPTLTFGRACSCGCKADCICRVPLYIHEKHCPTLPIRISWESVIPFLFKSILIIFKFFHLGKGMGFFKIQAKNFTLPFLQLSQLGKGEQKLKYSKYFHVCDMVVKVEPLSKIKIWCEINTCW